MDRKRQRRIAIADWDGYLSPVFDVAAQLVVIDVEAGRERGRRRMSVARLDLAERVQQLAAHGVHLLICGAISQALRTAIQARGIQVMAFLCGETEEILCVFLRRGRVPRRFLMPGCARRGTKRRLPKGWVASVVSEDLQGGKL